MGPVGDLVFVAALFSGLCAWVIWGWKSWLRTPAVSSLFSGFSVIGFCLASISALLQVGTGIYAISIGGPPFMDPTLLKIYGLGFCLSALGLVTGLCGSFKDGPLRFKAPALSTVMLLLWIAQAAGE